MSYIIGIDPGLSGYVAVRAGNNRAYGVPTPTVPKGKGGDRMYAVGTMKLVLTDIAAEYNDWPSLVVIEKQQPMPRIMKGVCGAFSTGYGYGLWEGLVFGLGWRYQVVAARTWQAVMLRDVPGTDTKARAVIAAQRAFPGVNLIPTGTRKPNHDLADALLLAEYGWRVEQGSTK